MRTQFHVPLLVLAFCACLIPFQPEIRAQNGLLREVYSHPSGGGIDELRSDPGFPGSPISTSIIEDFEAPQSEGDFYGQRIRGYIQAPQTGEYIFWISSDDQSQLYLSTDEQPQNARLIAEVVAWTQPREWELDARQRSQPIRLEQGRRYYIEALHVEGSGGDHVAVRWQLPDGTIEEPIPAARLYVELIPPQILRQPSNITVTEGQSGTFALELANRGPVSVQWLRNGVPIPGATNLSYTLPAAQISDSGSSFQARLANQFAPGGILSSAAFLTVVRDTVPPSLAAVQVSAENDIITVTFSEPVEAISGLNPAHYSISGGVRVLSANINGDGRSVILVTTPLEFGGTYQIVVSGIQDRATQPNRMPAPEGASFSYGFSPLDIDLVRGKFETLGPSTRRTALVVSEIMYNPAPRLDGRNLEFIEFYNSQESLITIGGYKISGPIEYTFPEGTFIPPRTYLVVAADPVDLQVVYGLSRVYGPYTNNLPDAATVLVENEQGAILLEIPYDSAGKWPSAPDGAGPSLVLARPSYGEADARAWEASPFVGGSPGQAELNSANPHRGLVINEIFSNSEPPALDFVELYNYSSQEIDLSGVYITDTTSTNKFRIPSGVRLGSLQYITFNEQELGFAFSSAGERVILRNPQRTRVLDALRFEAQPAGISLGRFPDGNREFRKLAQPTPQSRNARPVRPDIVINELMYNPVSGNQEEEYIELFNRSGAAVNLKGWRLQDGISFTFTQDISIPANGYMVVAKNLALARSHYPGLSSANSVGDFNGSLGNGGERIVLERPESSDPAGTAYIAVDEVVYATGGKWPHWADGGGSSLELVEPSADNSDPASWADSDESGKSAWVTIERRGYLDFGSTNFAPTSPSRNLHVILMDEGEALVDNLEVFRDGGQNLLVNPGFERGMEGWLAGGTHEDSMLAAAAGANGSVALNIRAAARGDTSANLIRGRLSEGLTNGSIATLRAQVRWLRGSPEILLRLHGNYLEAPGILPVPKNLGTPGAPNSRLVLNAPPSITQVQHQPILPVANQPVTVMAQIDDADRIALARLHYRVDPETNYTRVPMAYRGAGYFSAVIPGQSNLATAAFFIEALDAKGASTRFPAASQSEGIIVFDDLTLSSSLGTYRLWLSRTNISRWERRERASNKPIDATFVYNNERVVYNMGTLYSGSPFHWPNYNSPLGNSANYLMIFPEDDLFLGQTDFVLMLPSNLGSDATAVREQVFFWMADQLELPYNHRRYHHLFINGRNRGLSGGVQRVFEDAQQPNRDMLEEWFPDDPDGQLYKIEDWFEYSDTFVRFNFDATLQAFWTTNLATGQPQLKQELYRWWFRRRAVRDSAHDSSELLRLVQAVNNPDPEQYLAETRALVDIDEWMGSIALRHAVGDWDSFGYRRGKNMYAYKPQNGKWTLFHWDIAFAFGLGDGETTDLFAVTHDSVTERMMATPEFRRAYLRALWDIANGPMTPARVNAVIDAKYLGLVQNGIAASSPATVKQWIENRREYILQQLNGVSSSFSITSNGGADITTVQNSIHLRGTAPVNVKSIRVNGVEYPVRWTSETAWELFLALAPQRNVLRVEGFGSNGKLIAGASDAITIDVTRSGESVVDNIVFSEIHYNPAVPDTGFVELHNRSLTTAFDLSGFRINGLSFTFPPGSVIAPGGFLVVVNDSVAFGREFGFTIPVAGQFLGTLSNQGEALSLLAPEGDSQTLLAAVRYDDERPWPGAANGLGASLQLINNLQDASRVANWTAQPGSITPGSANPAGGALLQLPALWLNEIQPANSQGAADGAGEREPWLELYNTGLESLSLRGFYLTDDLDQPQKWAFPDLASIGAGQRSVVWLDGETSESSAQELHASFRPAPDTGLIALVMLQNGAPAVLDYLAYDSLPEGFSHGAFPDGQAVWRENFFLPTPGAVNDLSQPGIRVFINEWMSSNTRTIQDPDDLDYDDWLELYNAGPLEADLSGYTLTDNPANPDQFVIPQGTILPPRGFLLVWADNERATNGQLHASFRLSNDGETIALFAPDGTQVDRIDFGAQARDVSGGRLPDGGAVSGTLPAATPGFSNGGTDPDALQFTSAVLGEGQLVLSWNSPAGQTVTIQYKDNLSGPAWTDLQTVTSSGSAATVIVDPAEAHRFYRIMRQP